jgi:hypothetical protein
MGEKTDISGFIDLNNDLIDETLSSIDWNKIKTLYRLNDQEIELVKKIAKTID